MQQSGIQWMVEVGWCHCHTPMPISWLSYIHYGPIPGLYTSGKQRMRSHHPQPCPSTPMKDQWACVGNNMVYQGWLNFGVVQIQYSKAHIMVIMYPLQTYTKSMHLREAMDALTSPSILSINKPKQGPMYIVDV